MPTYERFEDLPIWRAAAELYDRTDDFITQAAPRVRNPLLEQLERSALAITTSIAASCRRTTVQEQRTRVTRARESADELCSMLLLIAHRPYLGDFRPEISNLIRLTESCSRQLRAWAESPQTFMLKSGRYRPGPRQVSRTPRQPSESAPPPSP